MKKILIIITLFINASTISCSKNKVQISYVYDGDTFIDTKDRRYRLFGIDTPEIKDRKGNFNNGLQYFFAIKARDYLRSLINEKVVVKTYKKDRYNRHITDLYLNNNNLQINMVKNGLARVFYISTNKSSPFYTTRFQFYHKLLEAQKYAYDKKMGI